MKYLIRLQPIDAFYFGGNRSFSETYIVRSNLLPQQTQVLGMIRRAALEKHGLLQLTRKNGRHIIDDAEACSLVGDIKKPAELSLGKIKSLSPVFLVSLDDSDIADFHFVLPKDAGLQLKTTDDAASITSLSGMSKTGRIWFEGFNPKDGLQQGFTSKQFWGKYRQHQTELARDDIIPTGDIYQEVWQTGIKRVQRRVIEDEDGSLYKKCSYVFKKAGGKTVHFGCILEADEDLFGANYNLQVYLGAERSIFHMSVTPLNSAVLNLFPASTPSGFQKAVVLGEMFATDSIYSTCEFVLNEQFTPFAQLVHASSTTRWATRKSSKRNLLPRGTVLYTKNALPQSDDFYTCIGYNNLLYI